MSEPGTQAGGNWLVNQRRTLLVLSLLLGLLCGSGLVMTRFNTSVAELLSDSDPLLDELVAMEERFPTPWTITFALTAGDQYGSVFNQQTLAALRDLNERYQALPGATLVDMETAWAFQVAVELGLPLGAVRVVCDRRDQAIPDLGDGLDAVGRVRPLKFARQLLRNPSSAKALPGLGRAFAQATGALTPLLRAALAG